MLKSILSLFRRRPQLIYSVRSMPLSVFTDCACRAEYSLLIVHGKPTSEELKRAWDSCVYDFLCSASDFLQQLKSLLKAEVQRLEAEAELIEEAQEVYDPKEFEVTPLQSCKGDIEAIEGELLAIDFFKYYKTLLPAFFELWISRVELVTGETLDPAKITVPEFIHLCEKSIQDKKFQLW